MNRLLIVFASALLFAAGVLRAEWKNIEPGVDYQRFQEARQDIHVTRINLAHDDILVVATRESERGLRVSDFARKNKAIAAINADYFDAKLHPIGLAVGPCGPWQGTRDTKREGVIAIGDGRARIDKQSQVMDPPEDWIEAAVSGWPMIVTECEALTSEELPGSDAFTRAPHPRSAVGLSRNGRTLYFIAADGRREGVPGLTLAELGKFMTDELGVCWAMNLDGGGSTVMWLEDKIVNRPSDGEERRLADHLAVVRKSDYEGCDVESPIAAATAAAIKKTSEQIRSRSRNTTTPR